MNIRIKISLIRIVEWVFVLSIILTGGTMYGVMKPFYDHGINDFLFRVFSLASACLLILLYILKFGIHITRKQTGILIGGIAFFGIYLMVTRYKINSCLESLCIPFVLFFVICCLKGAERFFSKFFDLYSSIIIVIAVVSLVFYFGGTILKIIPGRPLEYYNNGWWYPGTNYYFLNFVNNWQTQDIFGVTFIRNVGIYMEAPGFAYPLVMSLWWELLGKNSINKWRIAILLISLVTTFSTKALLFGGLVVFFYLYSHASDRSRFWKRARWAFFPGIGVIGGIFAIYILRQKVITTGSSGSWAIRKNDVIAAFKTWIDSPVFGSGFYNLEDIYSHYTYSRSNGTPTMGMLNILAFGGIYMFIGYVIGGMRYLIKARNTKTRYKVNTFLVLTIAFLCTSSNQYSYSLILFLALGWSIGGPKFEIKPQKV